MQPPLFRNISLNSYATYYILKQEKLKFMKEESLLTTTSSCWYPATSEHFTKKHATSIISEHFTEELCNLLYFKTRKVEVYKGGEFNNFQLCPVFLHNRGRGKSKLAPPSSGHAPNCWLSFKMVKWIQKFQILCEGVWNCVVTKCVFYKDYNIILIGEKCHWNW